MEKSFLLIWPVLGIRQKIKKKIEKEERKELKGVEFEMQAIPSKLQG